MEVSQMSTPSRSRRRPEPDPDERPLTGSCIMDSTTKATSTASCGWSSSTTGATCRSPPKRLSVSDRPVGGFGTSLSSGPAASRPLQRRLSSSGSCSNGPNVGNSGVDCASSSSSFEPRRRSTAIGAGTMARDPRAVALGGQLRRQSLRPYSPIDQLLTMGFDEESAKVAIAAAGGDVDRAIRLVLEDSRAHDAREACEWEFEADQGWAPFDADSEALLRAALAKGNQACELRAGVNRYLVDFESRTQLNLTTQRLRRIRRRGEQEESTDARDTAL
ncbi:unnamed protein product [Polarella glacialis]|uniref:UBA domain-containing protein n=1 Tax=Polarella glacialis TaxID=89957 RepID=A0A813D9I7_POLGL|nr:unnamed protein product [Polarella glacialis]